MRIQLTSPALAICLAVLCSGRSPIVAAELAGGDQTGAMLAPLSPLSLDVAPAEVAPATAEPAPTAAEPAAMGKNPNRISLDVTLYGWLTSISGKQSVANTDVNTNACFTKLIQDSDSIVALSG